MSHTFEHGKTAFLHNGGFDGDVTIKRQDGEITLPFADLRALVAEYVRQKQIAALEQAGDGALLGVRVDDDVPCPNCGRPAHRTNRAGARGPFWECAPCGDSRIIPR